MAGQQIIVIAWQLAYGWTEGWADGIDNVNNVAVTGDAGSHAKPFTESPSSARFRARMNAHHAKYNEEMDAKKGGRAQKGKC